MSLLTKIPRKLHEIRGRIRPIAKRLLWGEPALEPELFSTFDEYRDLTERTKTDRANRERIELDLIPADGSPESFWVPGFCAVCRRWTDFQVDFQHAYATSVGGRPVPNWRESLLCPGCRLNSRMRASFQIFRDYLRPGPGSSIYMTEQITSLFALVSAHYPGTVGSEFLSDGTPSGAVNTSGIRHEDLTRLSFPDARFDHILTFEVLEHVPDYPAALHECARVLKPGGTMLVTVPFHGEERTTVRARVGPGGIEHLLPPEYHGDPLSSEGCLCFYHFGWEFLDSLKAAGFREARVCQVWSRPLCYLGKYHLFLATK